MTATATPSRTRLKSLMTQTVNDHVHWTYEPVRPLPVPVSWSKGHVVIGDCSKGCQYLAEWGGFPDPMRSGFGPYGNSTTIWLNLPHIAFKDAQVGDIFVFGPDKHACMLYAKGATPADTMVWNFGAQGQPAIRTLQQEIDGHPGVPWWTCQLTPEPKPTAADKLRAQSGFYAWVAWKLGEGEWRRYGKAASAVRPKVPKRIPLKWWRDYASFLANRKRGNS